MIGGRSCRVQPKEPPVIRVTHEWRAPIVPAVGEDEVEHSIEPLAIAARELHPVPPAKNEGDEEQLRDEAVIAHRFLVVYSVVVHLPANLLLHDSEAGP